MAKPRNAISAVVQQHVEGAASLRVVRSVLVRAPNVRPHHLLRLDDRIAAHLDGLSVARALGTKLCEAALESPDVGRVFAATVRALEGKEASHLARVMAVAEAMPETEAGLLSAFGWVPVASLQGMGTEWIAGNTSFGRQLGIAACAMRRVDPGEVTGVALSSPDPRLRARALRAMGEVGKVAALSAVRHAIEAKDEASRFCAAWSMVLLGDRGSGLGMLTEFSRKPGPLRERALRLALSAMDAKAAHQLLQLIARDPKDVRALLQGAGIVGDPSYVPWLLKQMKDLKLARLAGESFSLITGLDLAYLDLEVKPPENFEAGPTDDPDDLNVEMDPDDGLPWPDPVKIEEWWKRNGSRFASGTRYFMGAPVTREHCLKVLREGFQRQRALAAQYLCLLDPGTPLFNIAAPAWRQQRLLAKMS